jgi:hypothetical protein
MSRSGMRLSAFKSGTVTSCCRAVDQVIDGGLIRETSRKVKCRAAAWDFLRTEIWQRTSRAWGNAPSRKANVAKRHETFCGRPPPQPPAATAAAARAGPGQAAGPWGCRPATFVWWRFLQPVLRWKKILWWSPVSSLCVKLVRIDSGKSRFTCLTLKFSLVLSMQVNHWCELNVPVGFLMWNRMNRPHESYYVTLYRLNRT